MPRDSFDYSHGSTGNKPSGAEDHESGERPDAEIFDWFWNRVVTIVNGLSDEFDRLDSNDDGVVDEADYANDADASSYKGADIDTDGDGVVDEADVAGDASTLQGSVPSEFEVGVDDGGVAVLGDADRIDFGSNIGVVDNGDGSVTVSSGSVTDTHVGVDDDGAAVLNDADRIDFGANINVVDNGDGTVTVSSDDDASTYKGSDLDTDGDGVVDSADHAIEADNALTLEGEAASAFADAVHDHDSRYYTQSQVDSRVNDKIESQDTGEVYTQSSEPSNPSDNDVWLDTS